MSMVSSPPPLLMGDHQPLQGEEMGTTSILVSSNGPSQENDDSGFPDVANLLQCNFLDFTPQVEMGSTAGGGGGDEFGLFLNVGPDENLGEFRFQVGEEKLY